MTTALLGSIRGWAERAGSVIRASHLGLELEMSGKVEGKGGLGGYHQEQFL